MHAPEHITKDEISEVYPKVAQTIAEALGREPDEMTLTTPLIEGPEAESIDFLDIVFRLERLFKAKIPRGKIVEAARGTLSEAEFERNGVLTEAGLKRLREHLGEVPAERFRFPMKVRDIPQLFTVETFCKLVVSAQKQSMKPAES
ncbi:MAG TPA: acyl carrier protein [Methylomirabilota bacterium]|nr:acyl carrier protein [Methylomirabilota bacterium]